MLSASYDEESHLAGLSSGKNDYAGKPCHMPLLWLSYKHCVNATPPNWINYLLVTWTFILMNAALYARANLQRRSIQYQLHSSTDDPEIESPFLAIADSDLIRNAFRRCQEGCINFEVDSNNLRISNPSVKNRNEQTVLMKNTTRVWCRLTD